jgi:hypothetical protein
MWQLAALAAVGSIMGTRKANKNAYQQQLQIVGDTKASYINLKNLEGDSKRTVGLALTKNELKSAKEMAKSISKRANANVAGSSALYAYTNFIQQKAFTEGTMISKGESALRDYGKQAEAKFNQARSGINQAEARKKSALEGTLDAVMAGAQGYNIQNTI